MEKKARTSPSDGTGPRLAITRKNEIGKFVNATGEATVVELASKFEVSLDTIRRDLTELEAEKVLIKTHGGAVRDNFVPSESSIDHRLKVQITAKETIGALAAALIPQDSVIMVNAGTTTLAFAKHLQDHRGLTIATNNLLLPKELSSKTYRSLHIFGGTLMESSNATIGSIGLYNSRDKEFFDIRADWGIFSVGAVSLEKGFSISNFSEASMLREMIHHCSKVVILADSSKFERDLFVQVAALNEATYLVSNEPPPASLAKSLKAASVHLVTP